MKFIKYTLFFLFFGCIANAQSDLNYTHFVFNKLAYNPGSTGASGAPDFTAIYRNQWMGIDGAPRTGTFTAQLPFMQKRNAFGLALTSDHIGKVKTVDIDFSYAYHIPVNANSRLSIGLNARVEQAKIDWDLANPLESGDNEIPTGMEVAYTPNFGFGTYYYSNNFYVGLSLPRMLKNALYLDKNRDFATLDVSTWYVMGGWLVPINETIEFAPSAMLSFNPQAPTDFDINANFIFMKSFWLGASYRLGDSIDGLIGYEFPSGMRFGFAFDYTLSDLEKLTTGSWEIMLGYTFKCKDCEVAHLRYF
ncbi:MAG: type IX secretion system membrane protein PorP/SprF [Bacteroidetes bacterium]|jgi:type IX secretion system PorP/SprF family membrane protein|nr:type IX secretion system membrane protein PorP/SprF [Bacteroidota bacterium]MDF1867731.1 type IX secretion system membrane protein PorP/SprF [Saprospiraceae bacterium]